MPYIIYILQTTNNTYYTGITTDMSRRLKEHQGAGNRGAKYTKSNPVESVIYTEILPNRSKALKREIEIKRLTRDQKTNLIKSSSNLQNNQS